MKISRLFLILSFILVITSISAEELDPYKEYVLDAKLIQIDNFEFNSDLSQITIERKHKIYAPYKYSIYGQGISIINRTILDCRVISQKTSSPSDFYEYEDSSSYSPCAEGKDFFGAHQLVTENTSIHEEEFNFIIKNNNVLNILFPWRNEVIRISMLNIIQNASNKDKYFSYNNYIPDLESYKGFSDYVYGGQDANVKVKGLMYEIDSVEAKGLYYEEKMNIDINKKGQLQIMFEPVYKTKELSTFNDQDTPLKKFELFSNQTSILNPGFYLNFKFSKNSFFLGWFFISLLMYLLTPLYFSRKLIFSKKEKYRLEDYIKNTWAIFLFFLGISIAFLKFWVIISAFIYYLFAGLISVMLPFVLKNILIKFSNPQPPQTLLNSSPPTTPNSHQTVVKLS